MAEAWTMGVEEEYQVIDADTRELQPDAEDVLHGARARKSGPVSVRNYTCVPRMRLTRSSTWLTCSAAIRYATSIARRSRVNSSVSVRTFSCLPFAQALCTTSYVRP